MTTNRVTPHSRIRAGLEEVLADLESGGPTVLRSTDVEVPSVDVRAIRARLGVSQPRMAAILGTSTSGYRKWEQGTRSPRGAALMLLRIAEAEPEVVARIVAAHEAPADVRVEPIAKQRRTTSARIQR